MKTGPKAEKVAGIQHEFAGVISKVFHALGASIAFRVGTIARLERPHAPKSGAFYTKTTNWGPMSGYLLQDPNLTKLDKENQKTLGHSPNDSLPPEACPTVPLQTSLLSILQNIGKDKAYELVKFDPESKELLFKSKEHPEGYDPIFKINLNALKKGKVIDARPYKEKGSIILEDSIDEINTLNEDLLWGDMIWGAIPQIETEKRSRIQDFCTILDFKLLNGEPIETFLKELKSRYLKDFSEEELKEVFSGFEERIKKRKELKKEIKAIKKKLSELVFCSAHLLEECDKYDTSVEYADSIESGFKPVQLIASKIEIRQLDDEGMPTLDENGHPEIEEKLLPVTGDWDMLWLSTPEEFRYADMLSVINTFPDWQGKEEAEHHFREMLFEKSAMIYDEIKDSLSKDFPNCPFPDDFSGILHERLELISRAGCITPFEFFAAQIINYIYLRDPDHKEQVSEGLSELLMLINPIQHGAENRNPGVPSDLDGSILHFFEGRVIITETEEELVALLLSGNYLEKFPIEVHPGWNMELWGHVLLKKQDIGVELTEKESEALSGWEKTPIPEGVSEKMRTNSDELQLAAEVLLDQIRRKSSGYFSRSASFQDLSKQKSPDHILLPKPKLTKRDSYKTLRQSELTTHKKPSRPGDKKH